MAFDEPGRDAARRSQAHHRAGHNGRSVLAQPSCAWTRPLLWVSKSHDKLAIALRKLGHKISANSVQRLLPKLGYSRQANRKTLEGKSHPDRNASCRRRAFGTMVEDAPSARWSKTRLGTMVEHINATVIAAQAAGQPVISVDTKKKELIGTDTNAGSDYRRKGEPERVNGHDFPDKKKGKESAGRGAPGSAGAMGKWLAPSVQRAAVEAATIAATGPAGPITGRSLSETARIAG